MELLERAFACLENGDWNGADACFREVLASEPGNPQAHLGRLLSDLHARNVDDLANCRYRFNNRMSYHNALPYLDPEQKAALDECLVHIDRRNEQTRLQVAYDMGRRRMETANNEAACLSAAQLFSMIPHYLDAPAQEKACRELGEAFRKDEVLDEAIFWMVKDLPDDYERALRLLETIPGWKRADEKADFCRQRIQQFREIEEADRLERERRELRMEKGTRKLLKIAAIAAAAAAVLALVLTQWILPEIRYREGLKLLDEGNAVEAYEVLAPLDGYKDSAQLADAVFFRYKIHTAREAAVGDYIPFGAYRQFDPDADNRETIEWKVLAVEDGRVLVVSRYALDCKMYHETSDDVTWATCSLRQWLNGEFMDAAFSEEEKNVIAPVAQDGAEDRIFLLSIGQAQQYFDSNTDRLCEATAYAQEQGAWVRGNRYSWWWLRSPGGRQKFAARVGTDGSISTHGNPFTYDYLVVRPAMWIDLMP